ncbi:MAG: hypothetical protein C5B52_16430 [Bacteroidetes bacterium]|nr:MAG: hypothetical protein C5B52_16430 [Bacteroidota bacterium]
MGIVRLITKDSNMRKAILVLVFALALQSSFKSFAQADSQKVHHVAIFIPLYLDSAFDASNTYRFEKSVPHYFAAGLDFYQGVTFALDSLEKNGQKIEVSVFDTKSEKGNIVKTVQDPEFSNVDMIIGAVSGTEYLQLASVAKQKTIPFISATYPNDGGVTGNPYLVIVNSKLNTHIQAVFNYTLKNLGTNKIVLFRRKNSQDDRISDAIKSYNSSGSGTLLNIQTVILEDNFTSKDIKGSLDSVRQNVIICGSLDENFGRNLCLQSAELGPGYQLSIIGMPTWENIRELAKPELKGIPIIYSTTLYSPEQDPLNQQFVKSFFKLTYTRPSDMAFRGFEVTYVFSRLLQKYDSSILSNLNDKSFRLLTDYEFKPIYWSKGSSTPDYYENKRVYMVKRINGMTLRVN